MLAGKRILLIVTGGIAAYKALELTRRLKEAGASVTPVLTTAGAQFVTPLSLQALSESKVYSDLFSLTDENDMGHIELSRAADLVVVAPASADILAKMSSGLANDLASTLLLATDKDVMVAPAMNVRMWLHAATEANIALLKKRGILFVGPDDGAMACGEFGPGRLAEPPAIVSAIEKYFAKGAPLSGRHILITSGPTHEAIDPVRYIANRSSGKQGHALAAACAALGAKVTLVSGPVALADPKGCQVVKVESAADMLAACDKALPADVFIAAAAVADWRVASAAQQKIKKGKGGPPALALAENPDILQTLSKAGKKRPTLVIGFAAETENLIEAAKAKLKKKGCDWIIANDVSGDVFGSEGNEVHLIAAASKEAWPRMSKQDVAARLAQRIAQHLKGMK